VEWWDTPEHVLNGIIREIEQAKSNTTEEVAEVVEAPTAEPEPTQEPTQESVVNRLEIRPQYEPNEYHTAVLPNRQASSAMFSMGYYNDAVMQDIQTIIQAEAPISRRLLIKRLLSNYGIGRNGARIDAYLSDIFGRMRLVASGTSELFFWKDAEQQANYSGYRVAAGREALDIAPEEVAQAVVRVVKEQFAIDEDGLISETARLFGYASVRDNVLASMKRGIEYAHKNNIIQFDGGRYRIS
jgi:hypothetical protein